MEKRHAEFSARTLIESRHKFLTKEEARKVLNKDAVRRGLEAESESITEDQVNKVLTWLERISKYVPIPSDKELNELIKIMVKLGNERARLNFLYDKSGLDLMKRVRDGMVKYHVIISELRAQRKEYISYWFTDEYWINDWSNILLGLKPEEKLEKYNFPNLTAQELLYLLILELASADSASGLEKPMLRLQTTSEEGTLLVIPTEAAAQTYRVQVERIMKNSLTLTDWVKDLLSSVNLP
ncbi:MAG: hypothetical protein ACFFAE_17015 [Candidatus Hodarchaeota archaeon]